MAYKFHKAEYTLGDRILETEERVIVPTREGPEEGNRIAKHLGLKPRSPRLILSHRDFDDGEYLPTFATKRSIDDPAYARFKQNYLDDEGNKRFGFGLKGKTVYIVDTFSNTKSAGELDTRVCRIASAAKYNGAESVVVLAYTQRYSAQERGVHDTEHPRMQKESELYKFDGQPLSLFNTFSMYLVSGVDAVINIHNHSPSDAQRIVADLNEVFRPQAAAFEGTNMRYQLTFHNIGMAPVWAAYIQQEGKRMLGLDFADFGHKICFVAPDVGATPLVEEIRQQTGLERSALAAMDKKRGMMGEVEKLTLVNAINMDNRTIDGMYMMLFDDSIRSGGTMAKNTEKIFYQSDDLDDILRGKPKRIIVCATRTNLTNQAERILASPAIDDIVITNADPRGYRNKADLREKLQMLYVNFVMAEAAKAVEEGDDPNKRLTKDKILAKNLLKVKISHGHRKSVASNEGRFI